ncbi:arylsulfatase [Arenibacter lacus]|uniref:arylsulfatase n=1 Tax=Arenibacter lacus TaxID=2608629 RepID=UPI00123DF50D|nr:arylsulfatase [Arenibacter lacus]
MRKPFLLLLISLFLFSCKESTKKELAATTSKPNIIYILADDLGYSEIGAYGQEKIETPHIDALAEEGMLFTQHYTSAPVCAPARYMLLTGTHSGNAYIRGNDEWGARGEVWNYKAMAKDSTLEGQRPLPDSTITIADKLKEVGYKTAVFGKWGLGAPHTNSIPTKMGFDYFYGYNCQRQAHTYYPLHLYKNENRVHLNNDTIAPHTKLPKGADSNDPTSYKNYSLNDYAPDLIFGELSNFVAEHKENPFFVYWATPIPHAPIQAPEKWVSYYADKFGDEEPYLGEKDYFPHRNPRAGYAAMVSYLDENIGKLVAQLKEEGIYDNTLIVFTSDNGPTFNGGADSPWFQSAKPFKSERGRGKGYVYEGGIRVPMIATWPKHIKPGSTTDHISVQYDVMATLADIAGYDKPENTDGISFLPSLLSDTNQEQHEFLYWEFPEYGGQLAIRMGDFKLVRTSLKTPKKEPTLELYNLKTDSGETINVADQHPEILKRAAQILEEEHTAPELERFKIPRLKEGLGR